MFSPKVTPYQEFPASTVVNVQVMPSELETILPTVATATNSPLPKTIAFQKLSGADRTVQVIPSGEVWINPLKGKPDPA